MRSLSAILGRAAGHEALLELLELDEDVKALKASIVKICNRIGAMVRQPIAVMHRLCAAYDALDGTRPTLCLR